MIFSMSCVLGERMVRFPAFTRQGGRSPAENSRLQHEMTTLPSPLILFGALSGRPSEADVVSALESARAAGYSDFMVYARSGLEIDYMGEEWLELVGHFLRHAERLGMSIWLYDEFNWPSGSCKRRVTAENPDFSNYTCAVYPGEDGALDWRFFRAPPISANVFDVEAMARFRALTHDVYECRFRRYFGSVIRGIFTDEPGSGHWLGLPPGDLVNFRWYRGLEADYRAETGCDFRADVETYCRDKTQTRVWEDYTAVLGHAFRRAFTDPATAWADRLGIVSTGHLMNESGPYGAANCNGLTLHVLKGMSKPGVDDIFTRPTAAKAEWLTLATIQHVCDRTGRGGLAELFALGPADLAFDRMRQQIWLFALHKVDTFLLALHFMSPHGFIEKPHYAMFFTSLQPWFFDQATFHADAREASAFAHKPFRYDVAARYRERASGRVAIVGGEQRPDLVDLLRELDSHQFAVNLAEEDEPCAEPIVFDFDDKGIFEERSGQRFGTAADALAFAEAALTDRPYAFEANEELQTSDFQPRASRPRPDNDELPASDLVLRRYDDGSAVLLNLSDEDRELIFIADDERIPVALPARGVWIYRPGDRPAASGPAVPVVGDWALVLDRGNRRRIRFLADGTARITVTEPVQVRFALCDMPAVRADVMLDGAPLAGVRPCTFLGFGYNGVYRETDPIDLASGEHVFTCTGREDRGLFLPVLWMEGAFAVREPGTLLPLPLRVPCGSLASIELADFAGKATYSADVDVPTDAEALELGTGHAAAAVRLGGRDLGTRLFAPWRYPVPPEVRGTRQTLEITVTTSIRPIFGAESDAVPGALSSTKPYWIPQLPGETEVGLVFARWRETARATEELERS